jgi:hypothetical protein
MPKPKEEYDDEDWHQEELPFEYGSTTTPLWAQNTHTVWKAIDPADPSKGHYTYPNIATAGAATTVTAPKPTTHQDWTRDNRRITKDDLEGMRDELMTTMTAKLEDIFQQVMDRLDEIEERLG